MVVGEWCNYCEEMDAKILIFFEEKAIKNDTRYLNSFDLNTFLFFKSLFKYPGCVWEIVFGGHASSEC